MGMQPGTDQGEEHATETTISPPDAIYLGDFVRANYLRPYHQNEMFEEVVAIDVNRKVVSLANGQNLTGARLIIRHNTVDGEPKTKGSFEEYSLSNTCRPGIGPARVERDDDVKRGSRHRVTSTRIDV
jgi:hypothetical protein